MLFPTVQFAVFFPPVFALSWLLMSRPKLWKPFIVAASYLFYAAADWRFCFLIAAVTLGNQAAAVLVHRTRERAPRTWIVAAAVTLDLLVLGAVQVLRASSSPTSTTCWASSRSTRRSR